MNTRSATPGNPRTLTYTVDGGSPCSACRRLINAVIFEDFDNKDLWGKGNKRWKLFFKLHYTKLSEMRESAEACELCDLIAEHWPAFEGEEEEEEDEDGEDPNFWIWAQRAGIGDRTGTKSFLVGTEWDDNEEEGQRFELFHKRDPDLLDAAEVIETGIADVQRSDKPSFIRLWNTEKYSRMRTEPYPYSGSDDCFQLAAKWITQCESTHSACVRNKGNFFPKRVLDTASDGSKFGLRLCQNETIMGPYIALSHCWGGKVSLQTTTQNIQSHLRGIPWYNVPNTFRDAITIVRKLGYRYLWIDALCILQDSLTDWNNEAVIMDQVYGEAVLTISSAESPNSWSGIFAHREQFRSVPLNLSSAPGLRLHDVHICVLPSLGDTRDPYEDLEESKWNGRAWTLQERILSPAVLHFTRHALIWECRTHTCTEDGHVSSCDQFSKHLTGHGSSVQEDSYLTWYILVQDYTRRKLTHPSDKMSALDGLAKYFSKEKSVKGYLAGLWEEDLTRGLLWGKKVSLKEIMDRAPSWSWASRDGEISYSIGELSQPSMPIPDLDLQILNSGSAEAVKDGLHAEGFLQATIFDPVHQHNGARLTAGFNGHLSFWIDEDFEGACWCLRVGAWPARSGKSEARPRVRFLVLEKVSEDATKIFKRVGTASIKFNEDEKSVMISPERARLTLV